MNSFRQLESGTTIRMSCSSNELELMTTAGRSRCNSTPTACGIRTSQTSPRVGAFVFKARLASSPVRRSGSSPTPQFHQHRREWMCPTETRPRSSTGSLASLLSVPYAIWEEPEFSSNSNPLLACRAFAVGKPAPRRNSPRAALLREIPSRSASRRMHSLNSSSNPLTVSCFICSPPCAVFEGVS